MLSPRQQRIKKRLNDLLESIRSTKKRDDKRFAALFALVIDEVEEIVEGEIDVAMSFELPKRKLR